MRVLLLAIIFLFQGQTPEQLEGVYIGYCRDTSWKLIFGGNGIFRLETSGHMGEFDQIGYVRTQGDTIALLSADSRELILKYVIMNDTCISEINESPCLFYRDILSPYNEFTRDIFRKEN